MTRRQACSMQGVANIDLHGLHTGIHVLCRSGAPQEAQQIINDMWARGIDPGVQVGPPPPPPPNPLSLHSLGLRSPLDVPHCRASRSSPPVAQNTLHASTSVQVSRALAPRVAGSELFEPALWQLDGGRYRQHGQRGACGDAPPVPAPVCPSPGGALHMHRPHVYRPWRTHVTYACALANPQSHATQLNGVGSPATSRWWVPLPDPAACCLR